MNNVKIAVVDSGIGGLSLLKTLICNLKIKEYIYFADLKNIPYGSKTREQLLCITIKNIKLLQKKYKPDVIVFGCNTIGTSIFEDIKKIFPNQKFFAIRPQIKNLNSKTLVIATSATIDSILSSKDYEKYKKNIVLCKMPKLATKVENYIQNDSNLVPYLKHKLSKFKDCKNIVLGCTHYYFVKNLVKEIFPDINILDGRKVVLKQIKRYLEINAIKSKAFENLSNVKIKWVLTSSKCKLTKYKNTLDKFFKSNQK